MSSASITTCSCSVHCVAMMHVDPSYRFSEAHVYGLKVEPDNPHDPYAIKVVRTDQDDRHVGYLGSEFARHVKSILEHGTLFSVTYSAEKSNAYRRILHLQYESPALVAERLRVATLERQLAEYIQSGKEPSSVASPKRKRNVTFSNQPPEVVEYVGHSRPSKKIRHDCRDETTPKPEQVKGTNATH